MLPTTTVATTLLLASLLVTANPIQRLNSSPITLSVARRVNLTSIHNVVRHDQARAKALKRRKAASLRRADTPQNDAITNVPVQNQAVTYIASVGIGNPPKTYDLIIDTGSSNTWTGARRDPYNLPNVNAESRLVSVTYGSGFFLGLEASDTVTLAPELVIRNQSIGDALVAQGFDGVDGILGLGPADLTLGTELPIPNDKPIPTVVDNLFATGTIPADQLGVYFQPGVDATAPGNGVLTFGGIDTTRNTSDISWASVTSTSPASKYWGIDQAITYGNLPILSKTAGIVDTGTTLILLATDAYNRYTAATGAVLDRTTGLLSITQAQYANLQPLSFIVGVTTFGLTPNAQIWPRTLNTAIGGTTTAIYLIVGDLGSNSGSGLDFINGYGFLERFYSVYDTGNKRVGFATTKNTNAIVN